MYEATIYVKAREIYMQNVYTALVHYRETEILQSQQIWWFDGAGGLSVMTFYTVLKLYVH